MKNQLLAATALSAMSAAATFTVDLNSGHAQPSNPAIIHGKSPIVVAPDPLVSGPGTISCPTCATGSGLVTAVNPNQLVVTLGTLSFLNGPTIGVTPGSAPLVINGNGGVPAGLPTTANLVMGALGADGANANLEVWSFAGNPTFRGKRAQGTRAAPTAITSGISMITMEGNGYDGTVYASAGLHRIVAAENWSATAHGSGHDFVVVPNGGTVSSVAMRLMNNGVLIVGTTAASGTDTLQIKGGTDTDFLNINGKGSISAFGAALGINSGTLDVTTLTAQACETWDSLTTLAANTMQFPAPWSTYTIKSMSAAINGGTFTVAAKIGTVTVGGLSAVTVNSAANTITNATSLNTGTVGDQIGIITSAPSGAPVQGYVCLTFTHPGN